MASLPELIQQFWTNLQQGQLPELGVLNYVLLSVLIVWQGPVTTLLGGAAAASGLLRPQFVFMAGITGNLIADVVWYNVGLRGNVDRFFVDGGRLHDHQDTFQGLKVGMQRHATRLLLLAKLSAGLAVPALLVAGLTRLRWRRWFPTVFLGELVWTGMLVVVGYAAGQAIQQVGEAVELIVVAGSFLFLVALVWYIPRFLRQTAALDLSGVDKN